MARRKKKRANVQDNFTPRPPNKLTRGPTMARTILELQELWVVRCFIGAIFRHSQVPGPQGLDIPG